MTLLLSRVGLWLMRSWRMVEALRLLFAHLFSFVVAVVLGGFGLADEDGDFVGGKAAAVYALPQSLWLVIDLIRLWQRSRRRPQTES